MSFAAFIDSLRLRHFTADELVTGGGEPPRQMWDNIVTALLVADELREVSGVPLRITSAYRPEQYNADVGGGKLSQHMAFTALDLKPLRGSPEDLFEILLEWRCIGKHFHPPFTGLHRSAVTVKAGDIPFADLNWTDLGWVEYEGGLGLYRTFIHLDTRGLRRTWRIR